MEQLKPLIDGMKKHWFWIFCGVTLVACIVVFYIANGGIYAAEQKEIATIKTTENTAKSLQTAAVDVSPKDDDDKNGSGTDLRRHPNEETTTQMKVVLEKAAAATGSAWETIYRTQQAIQVFPKKEIEVLNYNFRDLLPAESIKFDDATNVEKEAIPETARINFGEKIKKVLPGLAAIVGAQWKPNFEADDVMDDEIIIWRKQNQEFWQDRFTNYKSSWNVDPNGRNIPYTLQVLYRTEDLWILRSVLQDIIRKTAYAKGDVYANDLSPIKRIDHILIGKLADVPESTRAASSGKAGSGSGMGMSSGGSGSGAGGMEGAGGGNKQRKKSEDPIEGRYVDADGKDIAAKDYRAIYSSNSTDKKKISWKIAKRVKIRIGLQMDSREIQNLLANCANASFPLKVRKLKVNLHKPEDISEAGGKISGGTGAGAGSGAGGDRMNGPSGSGGSSSGSGSAGEAGGGGGGGSGKSKGQALAVDDEGYTKPVEIYGFVYIYNKVDPSLFKSKDDDKTNPTP